MSHHTQREFISLAASAMPRFFDKKRILEIGSLDINGTVRDYFTNCDYIGLDVAEGQHVDVVCEGQKYNEPEGSFDHVISCESMEHNPYWIDTFSNMVRLCKPDGLVLMTCATTGRKEHGTTRTTPMSSPLTVDLGWEYYRNLQRSNFESEFPLEELFSAHCFWSDWRTYDLYFCGIRKNPDAPENVDTQWTSFCAKMDQMNSISNGLKIHKYRAFAARWIGDKWFIALRKLTKTLLYLHD
ncbi:MAG: SAM-dependent methyltransferase [Paraglaciecola sp.]|jgi:SAM-dependent methyltransferase